MSTQAEFVLKGPVLLNAFKMYCKYTGNLKRWTDIEFFKNI